MAGVGGDLGAVTVIRLDASIVLAHSDKQQDGPIAATRSADRCSTLTPGWNRHPWGDTVRHCVRIERPGWLFV